MIELSLYRSRIGTFYPHGHSKIRTKMCRKQFSDRTGVYILLITLFVLKFALIARISQPANWISGELSAESPGWALPTKSVVQTIPGLRSSLRVAQLSGQYMKWGKKQTKNFLAKYVNGNISKGILNAHLNIRSLNNKVREVKTIIKEHKPNILGLSESELKKVNGVFNEEKLKIPGYKLLFPKSWDTKGYARVVVYVKNSLEFEQIHDLENEEVQSIWIRGGYKNGRKIYFCHGYREHKNCLGGSLNSQKSNLEAFVSQWETAAEHGNSQEVNEVHICGDMNLDSLEGRWLQPDYNLVSLSRIVFNYCNMNNFHQLVKEPTRIQFNSVQNITNISCLDHIYTNARYRCSPIRVIPCGTSDHDLISYTRYSKEPKGAAKTIRKRSYKNFKLDKFLADLGQVNWDVVLCCEDLDLATDMFTRKFRHVLNMHAPWIISQQRKSFCPWITEDTKKLMGQRDQLKQRAKELAVRDQGYQVSDEQKAVWAEYKQLRNRINNTKHNDEVRYKAEKVNENLESPSKVWATAKTFMGWESFGTPNQLEVSNTIVTKPRIIAELLNNFFINKVITIRNGLRKLPAWLETCKKVMLGKRCSLDISHVSLLSVKKLLKSLKSSRSSSVDELDSFAVKVSAEHIARPMHHIITLSLMQRKFPTSWKYSKIIPLHKKASKLEMSNYRPVSILSPLSKVLEKIIYQQIYNYFTANKLFHPNLHGFRQNRSTQTALLQMYDRWVRAASQGQVSGVILLDLSAAFDLVDADILVEKLRIYGVEDDLLAWVLSYMTDRHQGVWIDHVFSTFVPHSIGVPQGSILGPLFFLIYYNDLPSSLSCSVDAYADDSTLSATGTSVAEINETLTADCTKVVNWMASNQFKLNASKTHLLTVGTRERLRTLDYQVSVAMDGVQLAVSEEKSELLLGCELQPDLKWHSQIEKLQVKLKKRLVGLTSLKYVLPFPARNQVTLAMFNSTLVYCLPLFGGCYASEINQLQVLQNKAAQIVTHSPPRSHRLPMYLKLKWLTVNQLAAYHTLLAVFRMKNSGEPEYLATIFRVEGGAGRMILPRTRLTLFMNSFAWRGAALWNRMPMNLRKCMKISSFKKGAKKWIQENIPKFLD